jgi:hypothetical protein
MRAPRRVPRRARAREMERRRLCGSSRPWKAGAGCAKGERSGGDGLDGRMHPAQGRGVVLVGGLAVRSVLLPEELRVYAFCIG